MLSIKSLYSFSTLLKVALSWFASILSTLILKVSPSFDAASISFCNVVRLSSIFFSKSFPPNLLFAFVAAFASSLYVPAKAPIAPFAFMVSSSALRTFSLYLEILS